MTRDLGNISELKQALDTIHMMAWAIKIMRKHTGLDEKADIMLLRDASITKLHEYKKSK
jgi:hypothetical protein